MLNVPSGIMRWGVLLLTLTSVLLLSAGHLPVQAQDSDDALFIDDQGRVGIGNQTPGAPLDVTGVIRGVGMVPPGGIVMFSGQVATSFDAKGRGLTGTPYEGWQLCNGNNGAPNLAHRFILPSAAAKGEDIGHTGGQDKVTLKIKHLPSHNHNGSTGNATTQLPKILSGTAARKAGLVIKTTSVSGPHREDKSHHHAIAAQGGGQPHENMPPYYVLAFIMRLPQ